MREFFVSFYTLVIKDSWNSRFSGVNQAMSKLNDGEENLLKKKISSTSLPGYSLWPHWAKGRVFQFITPTVNNTLYTSKVNWKFKQNNRFKSSSSRKIVRMDVALIISLHRSKWCQIFRYGQPVCVILHHPFHRIDVKLKFCVLIHTKSQSIVVYDRFGWV